MNKSTRNTIIIASTMVISAGIGTFISTQFGTARAAFVNDMVKLDNGSYNERQTTIKIDQLKVIGDKPMQLSNLSAGSKIDLTTITDRADKTISFAGNASLAKYHFSLAGIAAPAGIYLDSSDAKSLAQTDASNAELSLFASALSSKYLLITSPEINAELGNGQNWSTLMKDVVSSKAPTKAQTTKLVDNLPKSVFKKNGDATTFVMTNKQFSTTKALQSRLTRANYSKSERQALIKEITKDYTVKAFNVQETLNAKKLTDQVEYSGMVVDKKAKATVTFKVEIDNQVSKTNTKVSTPVNSDAMTIKDLENSIINKYNSELGDKPIQQPRSDADNNEGNNVYSAKLLPNELALAFIKPI